LEIGFPRNDVFSTGRDRSRSFLNNFLKERIPIFKNVILYAPTFRPYPSEYLPFPDREEKFHAFIEFLQRTDSVCLVKSHTNQIYKLDNILEKSGRVIDISVDGRLIDLQKILTEIDFLITDYSSISIDALLLDIPCIFITSDIEKYLHATGDFCCDYDLLAAGQHVQSMEGLIKVLNELIAGEDNFKEARHSALDIFFKSLPQTSTEMLSSFMKRLIQKEHWPDGISKF
jgi:CDP-glycerol glycerophosphotransferase (TagB/SpsB family)